MNETMRGELQEILFRNGVRISISDQLESWAERWSGRPSQEQVIRVLNTPHLYYDKPGEINGFKNVLADKILALYPPAPPVQKRVGRQQLDDLIRPHHSVKQLCSCNQTGGVCVGLLDDLLALLGGEEKNPSQLPEPVSQSLTHRQCLTCHHCMDCEVCSAHRPRPDEGRQGA